MKKCFQEAEMNVSTFAVEDIITTSTVVVPGENETPPGGGL